MTERLFTARHFVPPIIISSGPSSIRIAHLAAHYYSSMAGASHKVVLVRPSRCAGEGHVLPGGATSIDDEALPGFFEVRSFLRSVEDDLRAIGRSSGWYLQQYIKLAAVEHVGAEISFVTDGDTLFSRRLLEDILANPVVLQTGERYPGYDRLGVRLGIRPARRSCVANGGFFVPGRLSVASPQSFIDTIANLVLPSGGAMDFSEYQLMGSILAPEIGTRALRMFRRYDLLLSRGDPFRLCDLERALRRYDAVAIEVHHERSPARRIAARLFYHFGYSW